MDRRNFIKGLLMAPVAAFAGAQLFGESEPRENPYLSAEYKERLERAVRRAYAEDRLGRTASAPYQLSDDGYLEVEGQSWFPIDGETGCSTGVMARYKHIGSGWFRAERWPTVELREWERFPLRCNG